MVTQKIDNLEKGDLVVIDEILSVFDSYKMDKTNKIVTVLFSYRIDYFNSLNPKYSFYRRHCRNANKQIIYKITEDNLNQEQLTSYRNILMELKSDSCIKEHLILKTGEKISLDILKQTIGNSSKLAIVKIMVDSNDLGLRRNKEIIDELWIYPDRLIKEIFKNAINQ